MTTRVPRTPRTLKALRNDPRVDEVVDERIYGNGYFVNLKPGYISDEMGCGTIREDTVRELCEVFAAGITKVD